jgi:hypothetical protein
MTPNIMKTDYGWWYLYRDRRKGTYWIGPYRYRWQAAFRGWIGRL